MQVAPGATLGPYRIVEPLGRGGMAAVYKAYHPRLDTYRAIKVVLPMLAEEPGFKERFQREARVLVQLRHPHIVKVYDFGEEQGLSYLVTEFVDGGTLAAYVGSPKPVDEVVRVLLPIADALDYAHRQGMLHRDIKPSNVLLYRDGTPVLSDFGLAKLSDSTRLTATGMLMGTPAYMAPEQARSQPATEATDRYALAVVAYELLTGQVPFIAETPVAVLLAHLVKPLPPPRTINPALSDSVERALLKGLAKEPDDRYPTASAMIAALVAGPNPTEQAPPVVPQPAIGDPTVPTPELTVTTGSDERAPIGSVTAHVDSSGVAASHLPAPFAIHRLTRRQTLVGAAIAAPLILAGGAVTISRLVASQQGRTADVVPTGVPQVLSPSPAPTTLSVTVPAAPTETRAPGTPIPTAPPQGGAPQDAQVARNRTLILLWAGSGGTYTDFDWWNPLAPATVVQNGVGLLHEPLAFYSALADKEYLWLAEGYSYSSDFKQLTIKTRRGISWSDGPAFGAEDVAFTLNVLRSQGSKVNNWGSQVQELVKDVRIVDGNTLVIEFYEPTPRFFFFMTYKFDIGIQIVPKHILEGRDWAQFRNYNPGEGLPVTTGPWKVVQASPQQKVIERRPEWWAVGAGMARLPQVERIVYRPYPGESEAVQAGIANQMDASLDLQPDSIKMLLGKNLKFDTYTGDKPPFGYQDRWTTSLYLNCSKAPFNDPDVRWALSYFIDRQAIVETVYGGASMPSALPLPPYPPLLPYFEAIKDLLQRYPTTMVEPDKGKGLLEKKGWRKGNDGVWADNQGKKLACDILGFGFFDRLGAAVAGQLKAQGVDATYSSPAEAFERFTSGNYTGMLFGHYGSVRDPYDTLALYQTSRSKADFGQGRSNFPRWTNAEYDAIVDQFSVTPMDDKTRLTALFHKAMEIWLQNLPDIQISAWYHRIPMNTTYWKNWPTENNPYVNSAFWHLTFPIILNALEAAQK